MLALKRTVLLLGIHCHITGRWPSSGIHLTGVLQMAQKETALPALTGRVIQ